jgi:dynein assembly factor 1
VPFTDICKPIATTDLESQGQDCGAAASRPLIQELNDEPAEEAANQPLPPQTCASDPALAHPSEDGDSDSQLPAATLLGNTL